MRTGLVKQALLRHRWSLMAPACTQVLAACVISVMVMTAWSLSPSQLGPAARAVVVASEMDDVTSVFLGVAIYLSIIIVGVTMNLAIQQQLEDIALVRVVGASPGQIRRAVALLVTGSFARSADGNHGRSMVVFDSEEQAKAAAENARANIPAEAPVEIVSIEVYEVVAHA